jgi:hypothetical protein
MKNFIIIVIILLHSCDNKVINTEDKLHAKKADTLMTKPKNSLANTTKIPDSANLVIYAPTIDQRRKIFIATYIDSLNSWKKGQKLPDFLCIDSFDYVNSYYWKGLHNPISLRKEIFNMVTNRKVLIAIQKSKNKCYNTIFRSHYDPHNIYINIRIPFQEFSNKDLASQRLEEL